MACYRHRLLAWLLVGLSACVFSDDFDHFKESSDAVEDGSTREKADAASSSRHDAATWDGSPDDDPGGPISAHDGGGAAGGGDDVSDGGGTPAARCTNGATQSCSCALFRTGTRSCSAGTWQACNCDPGDCVAGDYRGSVAGQFEYPILGAYSVTPPQGSPPSLQFRLVAPASANQPYLVRDGIVASVVSDSVTWKGTFSGSLDCSSKRFTGRLDAQFETSTSFGGSGGFLGGSVDGGGLSDAGAAEDAGPLIFHNPASANVSATYLPGSHSFGSGTWKADNPDAGPLLVPTGNGTWGAELAGGSP